MRYLPILLPAAMATVLSAAAADEVRLPPPRLGEHPSRIRGVVESQEEHGGIKDALLERQPLELALMKCYICPPPGGLQVLRVLEPAARRVEHGGRAVDGVDVIVSLDRYLTEREALSLRVGRLGVELSVDDRVEDLVPHLPELDLVAVHFAKFTDGRGYTLARLLRSRHDYRGELRATGDVLPDQVFYMYRCGFNAFEVRADKRLEPMTAQLQRCAAAQRRHGLGQPSLVLAIGHRHPRPFGRTEPRHGHAGPGQAHHQDFLVVELHLAATKIASTRAAGKESASSYELAALASRRSTAWRKTSSLNGLRRKPAAPAETSRSTSCSSLYHGAVEAGVLGQADDIADAVALAPAEHAVAAEARIGAQNDPHLGPFPAQALDQQRQDRPGVPGAVDVRRPQVTDQQPIAAKDVERQEAVVVVIAVEEAALLAAMDGIVGGIEVEHQFLWRRVERGDEILHHRLMGRPRPLPVRRPLQPAHRRRTGQPRVTPTGALQHQIVAQPVMIVDVLMAQRQRKRPLTQQGQQPMTDLAGLAPVDQPPRQPRQQADPPVRRRQQHGATVRGDIAAGKIRLDATPTTGWKFDLRKGTIRHRRAPVLDSF